MFWSAKQLASNREIAERAEAEVARKWGKVPAHEDGETRQKYRREVEDARLEAIRRFGTTYLQVYRGQA